MESKHSPPEPTSPTTYTEDHRGFLLTLQERPATDRTGSEYRAVATGAVSWHSSWRLSWVAALFDVRALVDRYVDAQESCARIRERRQLARAAGAVELPAIHPAVRE